MKTKHVTEINIDMKSGSYVQHFMPVKSKKEFVKRMNKMFDKGILDFEGVTVLSGEIAEMSYKFHGVN